jgi:hypothetical protein
MGQQHINWQTVTFSPQPRSDPLGQAEGHIVQFAFLRPFGRLLTPVCSCANALGHDVTQAHPREETAQGHGLENGLSAKGTDACSPTR